MQKGSLGGLDASIAKLGIPFWSLVQWEIFHVPPPSLGGHDVQTIGELAAASGVKLPETERRLRAIATQSRGLFVGPEALEDATVRLDARVRLPGDEPPAPGWQVPDPATFTDRVDAWRQWSPPQRIIADGGSAERSFSAAMFLRMEGVRVAYALCCPCAAVQWFLQQGARRRGDAAYVVGT